MPKAANALHADQISTAQTSVTKSVVGRDTRAEERSSFCGTELIWNGSDAARFSDHYFRISSVDGYARCYGVLTIHSVTAPARFAHPVFPGDQADTNPLTDFPSGHSAAQSFNAANNFMPGNTRQFQTRVGAGDRRGIGVTDSTCFHSDSNLTWTRCGYGTLDNAENARCRHFDGFVRFGHLSPSLVFSIARFRAHNPY
jgi:hypothetical protein